MTYFLGLAEPLLKIIDACKDKGLNLSPEASSFRALVKMRMTHGSFELDVMPEEKDGLDKLENDIMEEVSRRVNEQKVDLDKEQAEKENIRYLELKKIHKENREIRKIIREREKINAYKSKNPFFRCLSWLGILGPDRNKIKIGRSEETYYKVFNALETEREEKLRLATIASKREVLLKAVEEEKAHRRAEYLEHVATVEQALARAEEKIKSQEALIKNQDNNLKNVLEESKHYKSLSEQKSLRIIELEKIAREIKALLEKVQKAPAPLVNEIPPACLVEEVAKDLSVIEKEKPAAISPESGESGLAYRRSLAESSMVEAGMNDAEIILARNVELNKEERARLLATAVERRELMTEVYVDYVKKGGSLLNGEGLNFIKELTEIAEVSPDEARKTLEDCQFGLLVKAEEFFDLQLNNIKKSRLWYERTFGSEEIKKDIYFLEEIKKALDNKRLSVSDKANRLESGLAKICDHVEKSSELRLILGESPIICRDFVGTVNNRAVLWNNYLERKGL